MNLKALLRKSLFWAITSAFGNQDRRVRVPVLSGPASGTRLDLNLLNQIEPAYFYGTYDRAVLKTLKSVIMPDWTV